MTIANSEKKEEKKDRFYTMFDRGLPSTIESGDDDDTDIVEVTSNFFSLQELQALLGRYNECREDLEQYMTHVDDFEPEQRGEMARILAETEYFKKTLTLKDLNEIVQRLENAIEHYSQ